LRWPSEERRLAPPRRRQICHDRRPPLETGRESYPIEGRGLKLFMCGQAQDCPGPSQALNPLPRPAKPILSWARTSQISPRTPVRHRPAAMPGLATKPRHRNPSSSPPREALSVLLERRFNGTTYSG